MPQSNPVNVTTEFPDYPIGALPMALMGWQDISWRQDSCPSFKKGNYLVWVDHPDRERRENPDGHWFVLVELDDEGQILDPEPLLETDHFSLVEHFIAHYP